MQDVIPEDKQPELLGSISKGNISMRVLRDVFESFINMGPLSQVGVRQWCRHRGEGSGVQASASCQWSAAKQPLQSSPAHPPCHTSTRPSTPPHPV